MKVIEFLSNGGQIFDALATYPEWLTADLQQSVQDQLFDYSLRTIQPRLQLLAEELQEDLEDTIQRAVRLRVERNSYKYATLLATEGLNYNPIENYNMVETETVSRTKGQQEDSTVYGQAVDSVLHGHTVTQTNANTDTTTYANSDTTTYANSDTTTHANSDTLTLNTEEGRESSAEIDGTTGATEGARTDSESKGVYGFNSATAVPSDTVDRTKGSQTNSGTSHSESTGSDTVTRTGTETTAHAGTVTDAHSGTVTDAHTGTVTDGHTGTITNANSGTDQTTRGSHTDTRTEGEREDAEDRELTRAGNIGTVTAQDMVLQEREVAEFSFLKILTADLVNSFTLGVM